VWGKRLKRGIPLPATVSAARCDQFHVSAPPQEHSKIIGFLLMWYPPFFLMFMVSSGFFQIADIHDGWIIAFRLTLYIRGCEKTSKKN
jgi:hypothetical protein